MHGVINDRVKGSATVRHAHGKRAGREGESVFGHICLHLREWSRCGSGSDFLHNPKTVTSLCKEYISPLSKGCILLANTSLCNPRFWRFWSTRWHQAMKLSLKRGLVWGSNMIGFEGVLTLAEICAQMRVYWGILDSLWNKKRLSKPQHGTKQLQYSKLDMDCNILPIGQAWCVRTHYSSLMVPGIKEVHQYEAQMSDTRAVMFDEGSRNH